MLYGTSLPTVCSGRIVQVDSTYTNITSVAQSGEHQQLVGKVSNNMYLFIAGNFSFTVSIILQRNMTVNTTTVLCTPTCTLIHAHAHTHALTLCTTLEAVYNEH